MNIFRATQRPVEVLRSIAEIIALPIAGYWAFTHFQRTEAPSLTPTIRITTSLGWDTWSAKSCLADLSLDVVNNGKTEVSVGKVRRRAWLVPKPKALKGIEYFDPKMKPQDLGPPADEKIYTTGPLVTTYAPGASIKQSFTWLVERRRGTYALFEIELFAQARDTVSSHSRYAWDPTTCGEAELGPKKRN